MPPPPRVRRPEEAREPRRVAAQAPEEPDDSGGYDVHRSRTAAARIGAAPGGAAVLRPVHACEPAAGAHVPVAADPDHADPAVEEDGSRGLAGAAPRRARKLLPVPVAAAVVRPEEEGASARTVATGPAAARRSEAEAVLVAAERKPSRLSAVDVGLCDEPPTVAAVAAREERLALGSGGGSLVQIEVEMLAVDEAGRACADAVPGVDGQRLRPGTPAVVAALDGEAVRPHAARE